MNRSTWIVAISVLAVAGIFAAAYGSQSSAQTSFDSDVHTFMQRSDSSLLKIVRHENNDGDSRGMDEYSLATSNPALYRYLSAVDKAHNGRPSANSELQEAFIEVIISSSETRTVLREIELQTGQENTGYAIYEQAVEISGRYYTLGLTIPK